VRGALRAPVRTSRGDVAFDSREVAIDGARRLGPSPRRIGRGKRVRDVQDIHGSSGPPGRTISKRFSAPSAVSGSRRRWTE
jgi:hypothetical protein